MKYDYVFYEDQDGNSETYDFIVNLTEGNKKEISLSKSIFKKLEKLKGYGTWMGMPDVRHIDSKSNNSLWEIRIKFSDGYLRIFICQHPRKTNVYVILNYFIKKDEKTPLGEIKKADKLMNLFIKRECE